VRKCRLWYLNVSNIEYLIRLQPDRKVELRSKQLADFTLSIAVSLRDELQFRRVNGQNFSIPVDVPGLGSVQLFVQAGITEKQPYRIVVVDSDHAELCSANVMDNTCQIFRNVGLLVHFKRMPELTGEQSLFGEVTIDER
jgi:hypothetical protein